MSRTHPVVFWVRQVHRWISLAFTTAAALLITGLLPLGTSAGDVLSGIAIALLLLLLGSGLWIAFHHYTRGLRRGQRRSVAAQPARASR